MTPVSRLSESSEIAQVQERDLKLSSQIGRSLAEKRLGRNRSASMPHSYKVEEKGVILAPERS